MICPTCECCGGVLDATDERHCRETIQHDLSCRDCQLGGTVAVDPATQAVVRRVGPAVDALAARRRRDRRRLVTDGGQSMSETSLRGAIGAADVAASESDWSRCEAALLEALGEVRRRKGGRE